MKFALPSLRISLLIAALWIGFVVSFYFFFTIKTLLDYLGGR